MQQDNSSIELKHDGMITIATGKSNKSTSWKNQVIKLSNYYNKLSITKYTNETVEDFKDMSKAEKGKVKDVGGFLGGELKQNGSRTQENIKSRNLLTLDIDYGDLQIWDKVDLLFGFSSCIYSTHSHRTDNPRFRLIIPLSREVTLEEYEAVARMVASWLNIEIFDDTTYEANRFMYWPSMPKDGEFIFKYQDGNWLNPDDVLKEYIFGWQDVSYWPQSSRVLKKINKLLKNKQQDPLEKEGPIGAFCRAYSITDAMETFLTDIYNISSDGERATYIPGSTSNGVRIYDDKFCYSHHATDPISGIECNAFDLVRIHKFGELDSNSRSDTKVINLPSFKEMIKFVKNDSKACHELLKEVFGDVDTLEEAENKIDAAKNYLITTENGIKVNTGLLAQYIRNNSNYMIVRKQGYDNDLLYWYEDGYYKRISANELKGRIKNYIPEKIRLPNQWENVYKELITDIKSVAFEELDTNEDYINVKNGLYNIKTKELEPHNPNLKSTLQINCNYNADAPEPKEWIKFIDTLSGNNREIAYILQEWFGLSLSNIDISNLKKSFILYGVIGDTGKTQYNKMLIYMLGIEFICSTPIQKLTERFVTSEIYGKRMIIVDDQSSINLEDSSIFKALSGGGVITIEFKGKPAFPYHARCGILMCCNDLPYIKDDKGDHVYERLIIVPCNNVIPKEKQIKNIIEKLFIPEIDGIFLWALDGLNRLIDNNYTFTSSAIVEMAKESYKQMNDTIYKFLASKYIITKNNKDRIKKTDFENEYLTWVNTENGYVGVDKKNIKNRMEKHGIALIDYGHILHYQGIKRII